MAAEINHQTAKHDQPLEDLLDSLLTDITNIRTQVNALVTDLATTRTAVNAAISKLNADGGVSDTNYAAVTTLTAAAVTALGTTT